MRRLMPPLRGSSIYVGIFPGLRRCAAPPRAILYRPCGALIIAGIHPRAFYSLSLRGVRGESCAGARGEKRPAGRGEESAAPDGENKAAPWVKNSAHASRVM